MNELKVFENTCTELKLKMKKKIAISKDAIQNPSTCIGKVRIRLSVQVSVIIAHKKPFFTKR